MNNSPEQPSFQQLTDCKDAATFLHNLARAATAGLPERKISAGGRLAKPGMQCILGPVDSFGLEVNIFELDCTTFTKLIKCTFAAIFDSLGPKLYKKIYHEYQLFFTTGETLSIEDFSLLFDVHIERLYEVFHSLKENPNAFYAHLTTHNELIMSTPRPVPGCFVPIVSYISKMTFLKLLAEETARAEYALCHRIISLENELVTLMTRIVELATNTKGGISGIAEALRRVSTTEKDANRFFEDNDFDDLFDAAEEVAETIVKLTKIYQKRLDTFRKLILSMSCGRPEPPVKASLRDLPLLPPLVVNFDTSL